MPYRRLPNTDQARLRAMEIALKKSINASLSELPYTQSTYTKLRSFLPNFQNAVIQLNTSRKNQAEKNKTYNDLARKARMYVSHFIQVMNFSIQRGEVKADYNKFYGLEDFENNIPALITDASILEWGKRIVEGDQKRALQGASPIYNPSVALVKVNYEKFAESYRYQKTLQSITERASQHVSDLRAEADELILHLWNEIEASFSELTDDEKRKYAAMYGIVYFYRKGEVQPTSTFQLQEIYRN